MKSLIFLQLLAIIINLSSCTKEKHSFNIIGKWQITEVYDGYGNGGQFRWQEVPAENRSIFEFNHEGKFVQQTAPGNALPACEGTYEMLNDNKVKLNATCYRESLFIEINSLTNSTLIISHKVREGQVLEKFIRID